MKKVSKLYCSDNPFNPNDSIWSHWILVVLLAGVTISGTPCPRHFTIPFGAEAPSDHVVQA